MEIKTFHYITLPQIRGFEKLKGVQKNYFWLQNILLINLNLSHYAKLIYKSSALLQPQRIN